MEVITLNGKEFVKASTAAREVGYTSDYVGQLCRSGSITAERVGRNWYVDREELREHKTDKKRNARSKAREQVKKAVKEEVTSVKLEQISSKQKDFEHRYLAHAAKATYSQDDRPLMPELKKTPKNKDISAYVPKDIPEITVKKVEKHSADTEVRKIPLKRHAVAPVTRKNRTPYTQVTPTVSQEEVYWDYQEGVPETQSNLPNILLLSAGIIFSLAIFLISGTTTVQISTNSGNSLNQVESGYSVDTTHIKWLKI